VRDGSGCDIPCLGTPQTGHASAFKVISAPQQAQKAAMSLISKLVMVLWMKAGIARIRDD
jgi:hypothetical protein